MKKLVVGTLAAGMIALTGCVGPMAPVGGVHAGLFTSVSGPICATSNPIGTKTGEASSTAFLFFAWGDGSIKTAAANGNITKISHVDYHTSSVLGLYAKTTVSVNGD